MEKYCIINLDDPSCPSFCSASIPYLAAEEDVLAYINHRDNKKGEQKHTLVSILKKWLKTKNSELKWAVYGNVPIGARLNCEVRTVTYSEKVGKYTHTNIWEYKSRFKYDSLKATLYYFKWQPLGQETEVYSRAYKVEEIVNLRYVLTKKLTRSFIRKIKEPAFMGLIESWGNDNTLQYDEAKNEDGDLIEIKQKNILANIECSFASLEEMENDMRNPKPINLKYFINDLYGDG